MDRDFEVQQFIMAKIQVTVSGGGYELVKSFSKDSKGTKECEKYLKQLKDTYKLTPFCYLIEKIQKASWKAAKELREKRKEFLEQNPHLKDQPPLSIIIQTIN